MEPETQKEIIEELHTPDRLRESLDVIDIVLGFLSSGGGKSNKSLEEYIGTVLKMKKPFSQKVYLTKLLSLFTMVTKIAGPAILPAGACFVPLEIALCGVI